MRPLKRRKKIEVKMVNFDHKTFLKRHYLVGSVEVRADQAVAENVVHGGLELVVVRDQVNGTPHVLRSHQLLGDGKYLRKVY